jgi:hypothetical protein
MKGLGVELTDADLDKARASLAKDLNVAPAMLVDECRDLDMTEVQVDAWVREEAYVLRAEAWVGGHSMYTLFTTEFLNHLRRTGDYRAARSGAGFQEKVMSSSPHRHTQLGLTGAMNVYEQIANWQPPEDLDVYLAENNLGSRAEFYERLMAGVAAGLELFDFDVIEMSMIEDDGIDHAIKPKNSRGG